MPDDLVIVLEIPEWPWWKRLRHWPWEVYWGWIGYPIYRRRWGLPKQGWTRHG